MCLKSRNSKVGKPSGPLCWIGQVWYCIVQYIKDMQSMKADNRPTPLAYGEMQDAYDHFNRALFAGELPDCLITFQRQARTMGYYSAKRFARRNDGQFTDEIAMNPAYFAAIPLLEIMQTLVHEMVHLWQAHFGKTSRPGYHNEEWAAKMEQVGLMPSSTGQPGGRRTGQRMGDYAIPDGLFLAAFNDLIGKGGMVSWLDRVIPSDARNRYQTPIPSGVAQAPDATSVPIASATFHGIVRQPAIRPDGQLVQLAPGTTRLKFRCQSCGAQAWGKPSLQLLCGEVECSAAPMMPDW